mgnify:CR=1 FL=1
MTKFKQFLRRPLSVTLPALVLCSAVLTGCFGSYRGDLTPATTQGFKHDYVIEDMRKALEASDIRFKISFVSSIKRPAQNIGYASEIVMHDIQVDHLPGSPSDFIRGKLEQVLKTDRGAEVENIRFISVDLNEVDLKILEGNFYSGQMGRYYARIDAQVRVNDAQGERLMDDNVSAVYQAQRKSFSGRQKGVDQDWHNIKKTLLKAVEALALEITQKTVEGDKSNPLNLRQKPEYNPSKHISPEVFQP